jgi:hypothetical protein
MDTKPLRLAEIKARLEKLYLEQGEATAKSDLRRVAELQAAIKALNRERADIVGMPWSCRGLLSCCTERMTPIADPQLPFLPDKCEGAPVAAATHLKSTAPVDLA